MWFLCQEPCKTLDQTRKRAMEIGRENFGSIHKEHYGLFFKKLYMRFTGENGLMRGEVNGKK